MLVYVRARAPGANRERHRERVRVRKTTAYDILRHNGIEVGKMDFLGKP